MVMDIDNRGGDVKDKSLRRSQKDTRDEDDAFDVVSGNDKAGVLMMVLLTLIMMMRCLTQ